MLTDKMTRNFILLITLSLTIILIILGIFIFDSLQKKSQLSQSQVFSLVENPENLILEIKPNLAQNAITEYQKRIIRIEEEIGRKTIETEPDTDFWVVNYNNLAIYKSYLGYYKEAYELYLKSLELEDRKMTWLALGDVLAKMQAFESGELAYNKALAKNELDPATYIKLVNLYRKSGQNEKQAAIFEKAMEKTGGHSLIIDEYAEYLVGIGENEKAILMYEKLKELQPGNREAIDRKIDKLLSGS